MDSTGEGSSGLGIVTKVSAPTWTAVTAAIARGLNHGEAATAPGRSEAVAMLTGPTRSRARRR